ncbi:MAG: 4Fe-4S binding protein [Chloroflexi bacterium]|nr:4Fe-4S binding protein [Chloroflexota bacterium]
MEKIDLSVEMGGIKLRNPLIVGASDMTADLRGIRRCAEGGAGAVVMKSLSTNPLSRTRTCPHNVALDRFGKGLQMGVWGGSEGCSTLPVEEWVRKVGTEAIKACHDAGAKFIASMAVEMSDDRQALLDLAKRIDELEPDIIQVLWYGCPNEATLPEADEILALESELIWAIKRAVSAPLSAKPNTHVYPHLLAERCRGYEKAGVSSISLMIAPLGIFVDVDNEDFFGLPLLWAMVAGRSVIPEMSAKLVTLKQAGISCPICPSGGAWQWRDIVGYMLLGADVVEICSAVHFKGPELLQQIAQEIEDWMMQKGYRSVNEFIGKLLPRVQKLEDVVPETYPVPSPITPRIDYDLCNLCGVCVNSCVYGSIERIDREHGRVVLNNELCWGCGVCVSQCPKYAMKLVDASGVVYWDGHGSAKLWLPPKQRAIKRG